MRVLDTDDNSMPPLHLRFLRADLQLLRATEVASFCLWQPKPTVAVEWPGMSVFVASDLGLLIYEATPGWNEPYMPASGVPAEPWNLAGTLVPWPQVIGVAVVLGTTWDERYGGRRSRRTLHIDNPHLDLAEPGAGWNASDSGQEAWEAFVRACLELGAKTRRLEAQQAQPTRGED